MKLPKIENATLERYKHWYTWDIKQWFADDQKRWEVIQYRNRVLRIISTIKAFVPKGGKVLDVACAQGNVSLLLAEEGYNVTGIDINKVGLEYALLKYEFGDCEFVCGNVNDIQFSKKYDAIVIGEFLEHVSNPQALLTEYKLLLNEGGIVIVTTPNGSAPHNWKFDSYNRLSTKIQQGARIKKPINLLGTREEKHMFAFMSGELSKLFNEIGYQVLISDYVNSYFVNPLNIHKLLPLKFTNKINKILSNIPLFRRYLTLTLFIVGRKEFNQNTGENTKG